MRVVKRGSTRILGEPGNPALLAKARADFAAHSSPRLCRRVPDKRDKSAEHAELIRD